MKALLRGYGTTEKLRRTKVSYVENNLISGEQIIYNAKVHWFVFIPSVIYFIVGMFLRKISTPETILFFVIGTILICISIFSLIKAFITKFSTELAVTSKRVIAKIGFIRRNTIELNHSKVESINVHQSVFGRIFNFGTLVINGTGGGKTPISSIDSPLDFRKNAMQAIDARQL